MLLRRRVLTKTESVGENEGLHAELVNFTLTEHTRLSTVPRVAAWLCRSQSERRSVSRLSLRRAMGCLHPFRKQTLIGNPSPTSPPFDPHIPYSATAAPILPVDSLFSPSPSSSVQGSCMSQKVAGTSASSLPNPQRPSQIKTIVTAPRMSPFGVYQIYSLISP